MDVRRYSIASDIVLVEGLMDTLDQNLTRMEEQGFYTVSERYDLARIRGLWDGAATKLFMGLFEDAYIDARQAYLSARNLRSSLSGMRLEASLSLKELVAFIALTSIAVSYLFVEQWSRRMVLSTLLYALLLVYLYMVFPGRDVVSPASFIAVSTVSLIAIFLLVSLLPKLAEETKIEEGLPFLTSLGTLFSMAKRNLRRRRMRFILTLTSILILSMSFVALTSASTGYGLIYSPQKWAKVKRSGLVVKQLQYTPSSPFLKGRFHEVTDEVAEWMGEREGVVAVARKAESYPSLQPYGYIGSQPIYGILGFEPSLEPILPDIRTSIVEGDLPPDGGDAVLISDHALRELGGAIGDIITIGETQLRITGTFDRRIMDVTDLNG